MEGRGTGGVLWGSKHSREGALIIPGCEVWGACGRTAQPELSLTGPGVTGSCPSWSVSGLC